MLHTYKYLTLVWTPHQEQSGFQSEYPETVLKNAFLSTQLCDP